MSPKSYRFLGDIFIVPSVPTLQTFIKEIPIKAGICPNILENIKQRINEFHDPKDKICSLIFDEMSLTPGLMYHRQTDKIFGFVDNGEGSKNEVCDHAAVWMIRGVNGIQPWKQVLAFNYAKGSSPVYDIKKMFKLIVRKLWECGLKVITFICDQGPTNASAVRNLIQDSKREAFEQQKTLPGEVILVDDEIIIPIFDPPHLFKCLRNNLITKNLKYTMEKIEYTAKWEHIETAFWIDQSRRPFHTMKKLTDCHVVPQKINKMKVKLCTQVC